MSTIERIVSLCKANSLQQKQLAEIIEIQPSAFSDWKKDKYKPTVEILNKIADYFGVSVDYLLCKTDDPTPVDILALKARAYDILIKAGLPALTEELSDEDKQMIMAAADKAAENTKSPSN